MNNNKKEHSSPEINFIFSAIDALSKELAKREAAAASSPSDNSKSETCTISNKSPEDMFLELLKGSERSFEKLELPKELIEELKTESNHFKLLTLEAEDMANANPVVAYLLGAVSGMYMFTQMLGADAPDYYPPVITGKELQTEMTFFKLVMTLAMRKVADKYLLN